MGRASNRKKRRRAEVMSSPFPELARYDRASALAVLAAASVSPTAAHRQPSISVATAALHQRRRDGHTTVTPDDLPQLLAAGAKGLRYGGLEADEPLDPRLDVRARWGNELFRLAPGGWERPISIVQQAKLASHALDPTLDQRLGFRLRDLAELALRHMDEMLAPLSEQWPQGETNPAAVWEREAFVTPGEVAAAREAPTIDSTASRCSDPERAARALRWASCSPNELEAQPAEQSGVLGPVLAVRRDEIYEDVPVGFMLDGLYSSLEALTSVALEEDEARVAWERACRLQVLNLIAGRGGPIAQDVDTGNGRILALQPVGDGVLLAVDVAAVGLDELGIEQAEERLRAIAPGATLHTPRGALTIDDDEEVLRLVVVVGVGPLMVFRGDEELPVNIVSAEDLRWIITSAERHDDLAAFVLDWQTPTRERTFSFGPFDLWEVWKGNGGAFHRLGAPLTSLVFDPHHERAEWQRHAKLVWLERSLLALGLPGLCSWPEVNLDKEGGLAATLIDLRDMAVDVALLQDGTAVGVRHGVRRAGTVRPSNIAHALLWKLRHLEGPISLLAADTSVRIEISGPIDLPDATVRCTRNGAVFVVEFDDRIGEDLARDGAEVENRIGRLLAEVSGRSPQEQAAFVAAWDAAPAGIAIDTVSLPQHARNLGPFLEPHGTFRASIERAAAERLMRGGVLPGIRRENDARDLESNQIHPVLMDLFHEAVSPFDAQAVLRAALEDLERLHLGRWRAEGHHARRALLATPGTDVTERLVETRRDGTIAVRSIGLTVEEALRSSPEGNREPRSFDLQRIYAAAYLLFESGMRSETIHQAVSGTELEITEGFELIARSTDIDFDFAAYNRAHAEATLPTRPAPPNSEEEDADDGQPRSVVRALPELAGVDAAMRQELGFGIDSLLGILDTVIGWPVDDDEPVTVVTSSALVDQASEDTGCIRSELQPAVSWLTLQASDLRGEALEHWELDRRAVRLATRPLVEAAEGGLFVCPWTASATRTIISNHLLDGRLPWPQSALPDAVNRALRSYREERNKELERDVMLALSGRPNLRARGPIKKGKVLGLATLPRELDGICIDETRSRIWVIEAKDRAAAFSPHQVRKAIDEFHEEGGYVSKLISNVGLIQAEDRTVAAAMGAAEPHRSWDAIGVMATRRIEPAAYVREPGVLFCTVRAIADTIDSDVVPTAPYALGTGRAR